MYAIYKNPEIKNTDIEIKLEEKIFCCINRINNVWQQVYFCDDNKKEINPPAGFEIIEYGSFYKITLSINKKMFIENNANYELFYKENKIFDTKYKILI